MAKRNWHIQRDETSVTVSRRLPAHFDVFAETHLPAGHKLRIAQQVRQDMWRALQTLRGFAPVVQVTQQDDGLVVKAGGQFASAFPKQHVQEQIAQVLADPSKRARWSRFAQARKDLAHG